MPVNLSCTTLELCGTEINQALANKFATDLFCVALIKINVNNILFFCNFLLSLPFGALLKKHLFLKVLLL